MAADTLKMTKTRYRPSSRTCARNGHEHTGAERKFRVDIGAVSDKIEKTDKTFDGVGLKMNDMVLTMETSIESLRKDMGRVKISNGIE